MNAATGMPNEIADLIFRLSEGALNSDELNALADWLAASAKNRSAYVELLELFAGLEWERGGGGKQLVLDQWVHESAENSASDSQVSSPHAVATVSAETKPSLPVLRLALRSFSRPVFRYAALVALCLYGSFALIAWNLRPDKLSSRDDFSVAVVGDTTDVQWSKNVASKLAKSSILPGEPLKIESGVVELELKRGAKLLVEGPAQWSVDDDNRVTLKEGRLFAHISPAAAGFTVTTPTATVIDLGTEFGVEATELGETNVEVFHGRIQVNYSSVADRTKALNRSLTMTQGEAKRFRKQGSSADVIVSDIPAGMKTRLAPRLARNATPESSPDFAAQYAQVVMEDRPLAYWRFNDGWTGIAKDASGNGRNGKYFGSPDANSTGLFGGTTDHGLHLRGAGAPGWVEVDDFAVPRSFTVELWARSASPAWNAQGWFIGSREPYGFMLSPEGDLRTWRFSIGNDSPHPSHMGDHTPPQIDDRFHHYAGTYDSATDEGRMYFDGQLVVETRPMLGESRGGQSSKLKLRIGRDDPSGQPTCYGHGWLDEVAVYPQVLSAEKLRRHFDASPYANRQDYPPIAKQTHILSTEPVQTVWLGNLFDDARYTPINLAMKTDAYRAEASASDTGVHRAIYGDSSGIAVLEIATNLQFEITRLGWRGQSPGSITNDAWGKGEHAGPLQLDGKLIPHVGAKIAEGIGMHADSALTFDLDEIRAIGRMREKSLRFVCDRAGVNDDCPPGSGSIHMAVLVSSQSEVKSAWVDGEPADVAKRGAHFELVSPVGKPLVGQGRTFAVDVPLDSSAKFLTLIVTVAGNDADLNHGAWIGARLEVTP
jgi:hypothetical protein